MLLQFSIPAGVLVFGFLALALPNRFPLGFKEGEKHKSAEGFARIDLAGSFLSLAASVLLVVAVEEGGIEFAWDSPVTLTLLVISIICYFSFIFQQRSLSRHKTDQEGVLPWHLLKNRFFVAYLL